MSLLRRPLKRLRRAIYPLGLRPIEAWVKTLSDEEREIWAKRLGSLVYRVLSSPRGLAIHHLQTALGQTLSADEIRKVAREVFQNLVLNLFECIQFSEMDDEQLLGRIETKGWEHVEAVSRAGLGGIFVTGHIGNWELLAAYTAKMGYATNVVARRIYLEPLNEKLVKMRERMGVKTLYRDISMRSMIRCLQQNQFLGIVPDQDVRRIGGIFVNFFGRPAYTPVGPALLALASEAPIITGRDIRMGRRHLFTFDPPVYANRTLPREEEVRRLVTHYTKRIEEFIREHPSQWVWTHRRWRTQPPSSVPVQESTSP